MRYLSKVLTYSNLLEAWGQVRNNRGCAGTDGISIQQFAAGLHDRLNSLRNAIHTKRYIPCPLLGVEIPKPAGGIRHLAIPSVGDRILQTAAALVLTPLLESRFEDCSFAYRRGRSVDQAIRRVRYYHEAGYHWVVDADITACFDNIQHDRLLDELHTILDDIDLRNLIAAWLKAPTQWPGQNIKRIKGIPQGSPLSPLLANFYLDQLDDTLLAEGLKLIRFADDFLILCRSKHNADDALELTRDTLNSLELQLNHEKTRITNFEHGFRFLGARFVRSSIVKSEHPAPSPALTISSSVQPSAASLEHTTDTPSTPEPQTATRTPIVACQHDPLLRTLYILEQGTSLRRNSERLEVCAKGRVLQSAPFSWVDQIIVFGNTHITIPCMVHCLDLGIGINFNSMSGRYLGSVSRPDRTNLDLLRIQFSAIENSTTTLSLARSFVEGKIENTRLILRRLSRKRHAPALRKSADTLAAWKARIREAESLDALRGLEGSAARSAFQAWAHSLPPGFCFTHRERRPPRDPINALLSFGYTLLYQNAEAMLCARGVDPRLGFLHSPRDGHAALASDLMEEFRPLIVDALVFGMIMNRRITPEDFNDTCMDDEKTCRISSSIQRSFIHAFERKMNSLVTHPHTGTTVDYRRCLEIQASRLVAAMLGDENYTPMVLR